MSRPALINRRFVTVLIQFFGNIIKAIFYFDIKLRPKKRYAIPSFRPALFPASSPKSIPRIVWLTNYTNQATLSVYANYLFNRFMAPTFEFRFCDDEECAKFIKGHFSAEIYDCYSSLQIGAAKADLWRVLTLLANGGIYMDIDAALTWPPESFLDPDQTELIVSTRDGSLSNYFMAGAPGNPFLEALADRIIENIKANSLTSVFDMTGPTVVDAVASALPVRTASYKVICRQGLFTNKAFQYPDDRSRYWVNAQMRTAIVRKPPAA